MRENGRGNRGGQGRRVMTIPHDSINSLANPQKVYGDRQDNRMREQMVCVRFIHGGRVMIPHLCRGNGPRLATSRQSDEAFEWCMREKRHCEVLPHMIYMSRAMKPSANLLRTAILTPTVLGIRISRLPRQANILQGVAVCLHYTTSMRGDPGTPLEQFRRQKRLPLESTAVAPYDNRRSI
ncbi:uncharacterized protein EI90DRAFT_2181994 [Cantharellus anzutake]|uniref:uncharacterized protein n=1 Tax=Cantharellus anzutake TaxID=1750568 RepID=UPI001904A376|nr:uncharacterized protein EI90DRAFT_2181994 [Cantharellus anzutake]KAF8325232.1 hypothetical protein EI90DRAFT_2181994 [Cantharellus anzutake]